MPARIFEPLSRLSTVGLILLFCAHCGDNVSQPPTLDAQDPTADAQPPETHSIAGMASGIVTPLTLRLSSGGGVDETLSVEGDGPAVFTTAIADGDTYTVEIVTSSVPCELIDASGTAQADAPEFQLWCAMLEALSITSPRASDLEFSPTTLTYSASVPSVQDLVPVAATANRSEIEIEIADAGATAGTANAMIALEDGDTVIPVRAYHPASGASLTYELTVGRAGSLNQYVYGKASNADRDDNFGQGLAVSGDGRFLAVGANIEASAATGVNGDQDDNTAALAGAVYVFERTGTTWAQVAYLKASNTEASDQFGFSVALDRTGSVLAVGAAAEGSAATGVDGDQSDNTAPRSGAVYVFERNMGIWSQTAYLKASNNAPGPSFEADTFGFSVALNDSGTALAVGANSEDSGATGIDGDQSDNSQAGSGAVYYFEKNGGIWTQEAYIKASNTDEDDRFGSAVDFSASGDTLAVGAWREASASAGINGDQSDNSKEWSGAVYMFQRTAGAWSQEAYIKASNPDVEDWFGWRLALSASGDTLAVGSWRESSVATGIDGNQMDNTAGRSGAVYVFQRAGVTWMQEVYIKASNAEANDRFGTDVALSATGEILLVGARGESSAASGIDGDQSDNRANSAGAVYMFKRPDGAWRQQSYIKPSDVGYSRWFGHRVAMSASGATLVVGTPDESGDGRGINPPPPTSNVYGSGAIHIFH